MPTCNGCGGHVSKQFQRVFGDRRGVVTACLACSSNRQAFRRQGAPTDAATADTG